MAKRREVCKKTKKFLDSFKEHEPTAGKTSNWKGRLFILNKEKSFIAHKTGHTEEGEYAIKV